MKMVLGSLTLDTDTRQLLRGAEHVPLSPKAFDLLTLLVENRPRALSKQELHDRLWPATYVSESNLAGLVAEIRRAVDDDARTPRFVRTVHRFGYAFSGTISADAASADPQPATSLGFWLTNGKKQIPLTEGENILGRDRGAAFNSTTVSRRHARLTILNQDAYLEDLGSKNGTCIQGRRIEAKEAVADGDTIHLGSLVLVFHAAPDDQSTRTWKRSSRK